MTRDVLRPEEAPNEGARRLRILLKSKTFGQIARQLACDLSGVRRWALGSWKPGRRMRARIEEILGVACELWDVATEAEPRTEKLVLDPPSTESAR